MKKHYFLLLVFLGFGSSVTYAQYTTLLNFSGANGESPTGNLTLFGNIFYGMTQNGGTNGDGCIFSTDTNGKDEKILLSFNGANGYLPCGSLTQSGKVLFGYTYYGGAYNDGCIFSLDTNGNEYKDLLD